MGVDEFREVLRKKRVPPHAYEVVAGFYEQSLSREAIHPLPCNIALAYVDCDYYSSTRTVLDFMSSRLKNGMLIAFDDYYCFSRPQASGERRACSEVFDRQLAWRLVPYVQFGWSGMSFVVERAQNGSTEGSH
jgi:hypothetical protein